VVSRKIAGKIRKKTREREKGLQSNARVTPRQARLFSEAIGDFFGKKMFFFS